MSKYSGKCDFYDEIHLIHGFDFIKKCKVYIGDSDKPLKIKKIEDCIPYYPYVTSSAGYSRNSGTIHLMSKSWVDIEETDMLNTHLDLIKKEYKKCKQNKEKFDIEKIYNKVRWHNYDDEPELKILVERVSKQGDKTTVEGVHRKLTNELYREPLYQEMINSGYSEEYARQWVYGGIEHEKS